MALLLTCPTNRGQIQNIQIHSLDQIDTDFWPTLHVNCCDNIADIGGAGKFDCGCADPKALGA